MPRKATRSKQDLENEIKQLKDQLKFHSQQQNVAAVAAAPGPIMVPIRNFGGTLVSIPYEVNGAKRSCMLEPNGAKSAGSIPLDVWLWLEENDMVKMGYIARTDVPITNPNVIVDVEQFVESSTEAELRRKVSKIVNPDALHRIYTYLQNTPRNERTGKQLVASRIVIARIAEVTGMVISEDDATD